MNIETYPNMTDHEARKWLRANGFDLDAIPDDATVTTQLNELDEPCIIVEYVLAGDGGKGSAWRHHNHSPEITAVHSWEWCCEAAEDDEAATAYAHHHGSDLLMNEPHRGAFDACPHRFCTPVAPTARIRYAKRIEGGPAADATSPVIREEVESLGRYVDRVRRELTDALGRLNTTDSHQSEHCRALGNLLDDLNRLGRAVASMTKLALTGDIQLARNIELVHAELHELAGNVRRRQSLTVEGVDLLTTRVGHLEMLADTARAAGASLFVDDDVVRTKFDSVEQMAVSVFARLRAADAFMASADPDELDASDYAHHHMQAAGVIAKMYEVTRAHEPQKITFSGPFSRTVGPVDPPKMVGPVQPQSPADWAAVSKAFRAHTTGVGRHGGHTFPSCPVEPCASWTTLARARITVNPTSDVISFGPVFDETADWVSPAGVVHPVIREGKIVKAGADPASPGEGMTWKPTGNPASDIEAAWRRPASTCCPHRSPST